MRRSSARVREAREHDVRDEQGQRDEGDPPVRRAELEHRADDDQADGDRARDRGQPEQHARRTGVSLGRRSLATLLTQPPSQVVERSRARHVRHVVEVVRRRRRGRVPLQRVRLPRVVADARAATGSSAHTFTMKSRIAMPMTYEPIVEARL